MEANSVTRSYFDQMTGGHVSMRGREPMSDDPLREALAAVTDRKPCPHGHMDVMHVAPSHFDGPACPECSDAEYADRVQREEPCVICAALAQPAPERGLREAVRKAYEDGLIGLPEDEEHRWCDEDSGGTHRFDGDLWLDALARALSESDR